MVKGVRSGRPSALQRSLHIFRRRWQLHAFMLIPLIYIIIFAYVPMFGLQIAFKNYTIRAGVFGSPWAGFRHFETFFNSFHFWRSLRNTIVISLYSLCVGFPIPIIFALLMNLVRNLRFRKVVQTVTYLPHFISTVVLVGMIVQMLNPVTGLYGVLYKMLGGQGYPTAPTSIPSAFYHLYVWSGVWQGFGWSSIIYMAALAGVPMELHEAAMVDGASRLRRVIVIDLPTIMPTILILFIMNVGSLLGIGFEKAYLMQNSLNLEYSEIIATHVYKMTFQSTSSTKYSYSTAVGLFNSVVNCTLLLIVNFITKRLSADNTSLF